MITCIRQGNAHEACMLSVDMKPHTMMDLISDVALANFTNARLARYLVARSEKLQATRAKRPLLAEIASVASKNIRDHGDEARSLTYSPARFKESLLAQANLCTSDVRSIVMDEHIDIDKLFGVKSYSIEVEAKHVPRAMWKDPVWLVWNALLQSTTCKYIHDLYYLYALKLKKGNRIKKSALLKHAMLCCNRAEYNTGQLNMLCGMEAYIKIHYLLTQSASTCS